MSEIIDQVEDRDPGQIFVYWGPDLERFKRENNIKSNDVILKVQYSDPPEDLEGELIDDKKKTEGSRKGKADPREGPE